MSNSPFSSETNSHSNSQDSLFTASSQPDTTNTPASNSHGERNIEFVFEERRRGVGASCMRVSRVRRVGKQKTVTLDSHIFKKERQFMSTSNLARFCDEHKENLDPLAEYKLAQIRSKASLLKKLQRHRKSTTASFMSYQTAQSQGFAARI